MLLGVLSQFINVSLRLFKSSLISLRLKAWRKFIKPLLYELINCGSSLIPDSDSPGRSLYDSTCWFCVQKNVYP